MTENYATTTALIPFTFDTYACPVRLDDQSAPWWSLLDICRAIALQNTTDAAKRLRPHETTILAFVEDGIPHRLLLVNESGLYRLIMRSNKPEAERFQDWVCQEVLPQIRKTGKYEAPVVALPAPTYHAQIDDLRICASFLHDLGMFEDRDKLMLADMARTAIQLRQVPQSGDMLALPAPQGFFLAERVTALGYRLSRKDEASLLASGLARQVASEYRTRHKEAPRQSQKFVDGAVRPVNWYRQDEAAWIDPMIQAACAHKGFIIAT